jgi:hypothetical protein
MEKIDRLGWAAGIAVVSHGVSVGIRTNEPDALAGLLHRLAPGWKPAASPRVERLYSIRVGNGPGEGIRRFTLLYQDETRIARSLDSTAVLRTLETEIQLYLAERARGRIFVHAGVVAWAGGAVVIPGRSTSGKSTLVAALVRAGATYYSDEYAVLDARGRVHAYRTPLSLREDGAGAVGEPPPVVPVDTAAPLPVRVVLLTQYRSGARWRPTVLSPGRAAIELLAHTLAARWRPARALSTLARAVAGARVLKSDRGEASELVSAITGHAGAPPTRLAG